MRPWPLAPTTFRLGQEGDVMGKLTYALIALAAAIYLVWSGGVMAH